jgi:hypothetical protein
LAGNDNTSVLLTRTSLIASFLRRNAEILLPALLFAGFLIAINWQLFVVPQLEWGDVAANAIEVQNAKHFHELLGNYSRWHFHHPGPFFFYVFAAGEAVFYDLLHIVPTPLNGEALAEIILSTAFLFLAILVFYDNIRKPLFPAAAVLVSVLFVYVIDTAIPTSTISLWPPYMAMFCFLLFTTCCASVAARNWKHVALLALSGMIMIHAHVAHLFFVPILTAAALLTAGFHELKRGTLRTTVRVYRQYFIIALGIVGLFLLPIAIDWAIHHPNNIHQIRVYLRQHRGEHNSLHTTVLYTLSFFTYDVTPETALRNLRSTFADILNPKPFVSFYWCTFLLIALLSLLSSFGRLRRPSLFIKLVFVEVGLIVLLFLYWGYRVTGAMYTFNGYFFFSIQLLALFAFSGLLVCNVLPAFKKRSGMAVACVFATPVLLISGLKIGRAEHPDIVQVVSSLKALHERGFVFTFTGYESWATGVGVLSQLKRSGARVCVDPDWEFTLSPEETCKSASGYYHVSFSSHRPLCKSPCSVIYETSALCVTGTPDPPH